MQQINIKNILNYRMYSKKTRCKCLVLTVLVIKCIESLNCLNKVINNIRARNSYRINKFCCFPISFNDVEHELEKKNAFFYLNFLFHFQMALFPSLFMCVRFNSQVYTKHT